MAGSINLPLLNSLLPNGFRLGSNVLVEFDPNSLWYETSISLAAEAVREGSSADYHTFQHQPNEVKEALAKQEAPVNVAMASKSLRILDSYSLQLGEKNPTAPPFQNFVQQSMALSDWKAKLANLRNQDQEKTRRESDRIHIDDNTSALLAMNDEKTVNDFWLAGVESTRRWNLLMFNSFCVGIASDAFYKKLETIADMIIDIRAKETRSGESRDFIRVRTLRGSRLPDSKWKRFDIEDNGRVALSEDHSMLMSDGATS